MTALGHEVLLPAVVDAVARDTVPSSLEKPIDLGFNWTLSCPLSTERKSNVDSLGTTCHYRGSRLPNRTWEFSMLDEGVCAEVRVGSEHLQLFSEQNAQGVQVSVYNVNAKNWIAPSESVETIEQGKLKAATYAEGYLRQVANLELPPLKWKESRAA